MSRWFEQSLRSSQRKATFFGFFLSLRPKWVAPTQIARGRSGLRPTPPAPRARAGGVFGVGDRREFAAREPALIGAAVADADVGFAPGDVDVGVGGQQRGTPRAFGRPDFGEMAGDVARGPAACGDADLGGGVLALKACETADGIAERFGLLQKRAALGGQCVAPIAALEEALAEAALQLRHAAREGGQGGAGGLFRARQAAGIGHGEEEGVIIEFGSVFHF